MQISMDADEKGGISYDSKTISNNKSGTDDTAL